MPRLVVTLLALFVTVWGSTCPVLPTVDDVDLQAFDGQWFEIAATSDISTHYTNDFACATLNYTFAASPGAVYSGNPNNDPSASRVKSTGTLGVGVSSGKPTLAFAAEPADHWVLAVFGEAEDGYSVTVIWSCRDGFPGDLWVLSRTPKLPSNVQFGYIFAKLSALGIDAKGLGLTRTLHSSDCKYS